MSKDNPIKKHQYKSGESVNLNGRSKGSLGGKKVVKEYLAFLQEEVNPLTGIKELKNNTMKKTIMQLHNPCTLKN